MCEHDLVKVAVGGHVGVHGGLLLSLEHCVGFPLKRKGVQLPQHVTVESLLS